MAGVQCRAELNTLCIDLDPLLPFGQFLFGTQMLPSFFALEETRVAAFNAVLMACLQ